MRQNLSYILIAITACVVIGGGYFIYQNSVALPGYTPPRTEPAGDGVVGNAKADTDHFDVTITYTDKGFDPSELTVPQGTRVRFINNSTSTFWPAVGVHPTHTLYPEKEDTDCLGSSFDACQDLKPGEFFDFTLYYPGSWPFHDHLHAYNTGTVTVVAATSTAH